MAEKRVWVFEHSTYVNGAMEWRASTMEVSTAGEAAGQAAKWLEVHAINGSFPMVRLISYTVCPEGQKTEGS